MAMDDFCVKQEIPDFYSLEEELNEECASMELENQTVTAIDFLEHCVLCLRKLLNDSTNHEGMPESNPKPKRGRGRPPKKKIEIKEERSVPEASFSWSLTSFSHIWPYLNEKWKRKVGDDNSSSSIKFVRKLSEDNLCNVTEVPPMCGDCGVKIQELDKLHREITSKVLEIHGVIKNSGPNGSLSWRDSAFEQALENTNNPLTKLFLADLRNGCTRSTESVDPTECLAKREIELGESEMFLLGDDGAADAANDSMINEKKLNVTKNRPRRRCKGSGGTIPYRRPIWEKARKLIRDKTRKPIRDKARKPIRDKARKPIREQAGKPYQPPYYCEICNDKFRGKELEEHVRTHVQDYLVRCPNSQCYYVCATMAKLERAHLKCHPECAAEMKDDFKRKCETCGFETATMSKFRVHVATHETTEKNFPCPIKDCPQVFTARPSVFLHLETHAYNNKPKDFENQRCESCEKEIPVNVMEEHLKTIHQSTEVVKCLDCQFVFENREALINHMIGLHKERYGRTSGFLCDICKDGKRHMKIRRHYYETHSIGTKVVCEHCNLSFLSKRSLDVHKRIKHGPKTRKKHICKKCEQPVEFKFRQDLLKHDVEVHDTSPYQCTVCNKHFICRSTLMLHQKSHDANYKSRSPDFKCGINGCTKIYKNKNHLLRHQRDYHIGPKNHICDLCGNSYSTALSLWQHKRITHEDKESCVCEVCGGRYKTKHNLRVHMRSHTGERPHQCEICGKGFTQKVSLKAHYKIHQKNG